MLALAENLFVRRSHRNCRRDAIRQSSLTNAMAIVLMSDDDYLGRRPSDSPTNHRQANRRQADTTRLWQAGRTRGEWRSGTVVGLPGKQIGRAERVGRFAPLPH